MAHTLTIVEPIWPMLQNASKTLISSNGRHQGCGITCTCVPTCNLTTLFLPKHSLSKLYNILAISTLMCFSILFVHKPVYSLVKPVCSLVKPVY